MAERFDLAARARSFRWAARGVFALVVHEHNARIHLAATVAVAALAFALGIDATGWALLALAMACVWAAEAMNTAVEALADAVHPDEHELVARAKDVAAGGVLITAIFAAVVGLLVMGPPLWRWVAGS